MTPATTPAATSGTTSGAKRIFLHIGAPKTGTTYLQEVLFRNRAALAEQGVLCPGDAAVAHYEAVLDLRGLSFGGYRDPRAEGAWDELAAQARAWDGHCVVVSHELLSGADDEAMARAAASFGDAEVHAVYTARDLGRQVPAMWQESVKNGQRLTFEQYLRRLSARSRQSRAARIFWRQQHVLEVLTRWSAHLPDDRLHVVLVPPPDQPADLLWRRFAGVVGIRPDDLDVDVRRTNASLRLAEAELLRRVNVALDDDLEWPEYGPTVKFWFAEQVLAGHGSGPRAAVPASMHGWLEQQADEMAEALAASDWHVVGDLADLRPTVRKGLAAEPTAGSAEQSGGDEPAGQDVVAGPEVTPVLEDVLQAATTALATLLVERAQSAGHSDGPGARGVLRRVVARVVSRARQLRRRRAGRAS